MHKVSVRDAEKQLRRLIGEVEQGQEVVITRDDGASSISFLYRSQRRVPPLAVQVSCSGLLVRT